MVDDSRIDGLALWSRYEELPIKRTTAGITKAPIIG
jgi:hypothetical protein